MADETDSQKEAVAPAAIPTGTTVDFAPTIARLESRARWARYRVFATLALLFGGTFFTAYYIVKNVLNNPMERLLFVDPHQEDYRDVANSSFTPSRVSSAFSARITRLVAKLDGEQGIGWGMKYKLQNTPDEKAIAQTKIEITETMGNLEKAIGVESVQNTSGWKGTISNVVLSIGAIGLLLFLIQVAVSFMRYYTRVAESYDAQADAFRASGGNPHLAYGFLQHLSTQSIDLGAQPTTLYEKALDTIKELASKQKA